MRKSLQRLFSNPFLVMQAADANLRALTDAERKRLHKLIKLLKSIQAGSHVQNRTLQNNLTEEQYAGIAIEWEQEIQLREIKYGEKPKEITRYESLLRKADFEHNRGDHYSRKGISTTAKKFMGMSKNGYEKAIEYLGEQIAIDPSLISWLDRDFDPTAANSPASVPRAKTSRGTNNLSRIRFKSIKDVKQGALEQAIFDLVFELKQCTSTESNTKLQELLEYKEEL